jgi:hypothetical protein
MNVSRANFMSVVLSAAGETSGGRYSFKITRVSIFLTWWCKALTRLWEVLRLGEKKNFRSLRSVSSTSHLPEDGLKPVHHGGPFFCCAV